MGNPTLSVTHPLPTWGASNVTEISKSVTASQRGPHDEARHQGIEKSDVTQSPFARCRYRITSMECLRWPHPEDRLHLRLHRARSVVLTAQELVEIRAAQRTFEGAYIRTALGQFSFALVVLKIFTAEFYSIGALFATYGVGVLMVSLYRRYEGNRQFFSEVGEDGLGRKKFRTSGNAVVVLTALSVAAYASLIVLTARLES